METMMQAARVTNKKDKNKETLDADLWGQLQEHIPLQTIYEKLSRRNLFRLRLVNKEWNQAALQWLLPEPSFVTIVAGVHLEEEYLRYLTGWYLNRSEEEDLRYLNGYEEEDMRYLNGIVTYNSASGKFKFDRQQHLLLLDVKTHVPPFEVEGLVLCHHPDDLEERGVYNVHNRTWHTIPAGPGTEQSKTTLSACGLVVDTTVRPYTFKLIEGSRSFRTQIYDSKSRLWRRTSSRFPSSFMEVRKDILEYSCTCHNDDVYISLGRHKILKYSLKDDKWTELKFPAFSNRITHVSPDNVLGVWAGRIFTTREERGNQRVSVWELVDFERQEWVEYARMSTEQYERLLAHEMDSFFNNIEAVLRSFFRKGYLLVSAWMFDGACANVLVLFDIATKTWQKVDLPKRTMVMGKLDLGSFLESEDSEENEEEQ